MIIGLTYDHCTAYPMDCNAELAASIATEYETLENLCQTLCTMGHTVVRIGNMADLVDRLAAGQQLDMVFNLCANRSQAFGAAQVPALLDAYKIPYTFAGALTMSLCQQAGMMQSLLRENGIPVCEALASADNSASSARSAAPAMNSAMNDAEYVVAIAGSASQAEALGTLCCDSARSNELAGTSRSTVDLLERTALAAWRTLDGQDAGCVYLRVDADGRAQVARVEPMPSLNADHSDLLKVADSAGVTLERLVETVMQSATSRAATAAATKHPLPRPHMVATPSRERAT